MKSSSSTGENNAQGLGVLAAAIDATERKSIDESTGEKIPKLSGPNLPTLPSNPTGTPLTSHPMTQGQRDAELVRAAQALVSKSMEENANKEQIITETTATSTQSVQQPSVDPLAAANGLMFSPAVAAAYASTATNGQTLPYQYFPQYFSQPFYTNAFPGSHALLWTQNGEGIAPIVVPNMQFPVQQGESSGTANRARGAMDEREETNVPDDDMVMNDPTITEEEQKQLQLAIDTAIRSGASKKDLKYACPACNRVFSRIYNLKSHIRSHQNFRPFKCKMCMASFTRNHDLNRHERIHSQQKPFSCSACGKAFSRKDALRRHERMDPEGRKVHCIAIARTNPQSQSFRE